MNLRNLQFLQSRRSRSIMIAIGVALGAAVISKNPLVKSLSPYSVGDIAQRDEIATKHLRIIDETLTEQKRANALAKTPFVFDFNSEARLQLITNLDSVMKDISPTKRSQEVIEAHLGFSLSREQWRQLQRPAFVRLFLAAVKQSATLFQGFWIIENKSDLPPSEVTVRDLSTNNEEAFTASDFRRKLLDPSEVTSRLGHWLQIQVTVDRNLQRQLSTSDISDMLHLLSRVILPDISYNRIESEQRRLDAVASSDPVVIDVPEGHVFLKRGETIERKHLLLLQAQNKTQDTLSGFQTTALMAIFLFILIMVLYEVGRSNFRKFKMTFRDQWVIGLFMVLSLGVYGFGIHLLTSAREATSFGPALIYLLPLAFSGMTLRLFTSMEITHFFILIQAICLSLLQENAFFGIVFYVTSLSAAARMRHIAQRSHVFRAGFTAGAVKALMTLVGVAAGLLYQPQAGFAPFFYVTIMVFSLASGFISSILVLGLQPLIELMGYTTDLRLMELASTNHPLLRDLILKAPGTYFHSFTVSQLAEKAAEAIHGNGLFARVASLYHDVGKVAKPHYFIENIKGENKHDKLAPTMSALIICNHVKEGIELGIEHKLPPSIIEVIPQHHGTSLISYFYDKAQKLAEAEGTEAPDDRDFRYPGPRPQTREGAIILLADAVEATVKSLPKKTPDQMRQVVHQTIQRFFLDGQLDECDLTLKDLNAIAMAFLQVLQGVYHQRIEYPAHKDDGDEASRVSTLRRNS